jgi:hypothetical protein
MKIKYTNIKRQVIAPVGGRHFSIAILLHYFLHEG